MRVCVCVELGVPPGFPFLSGQPHVHSSPLNNTCSTAGSNPLSKPLWQLPIAFLQMLRNKICASQRTVVARRKAIDAKATAMTATINRKQSAVRGEHRRQSALLRHAVSCPFALVHTTAAQRKSPARRMQPFAWANQRRAGLSGYSQHYRYQIQSLGNAVEHISHVAAYGWPADLLDMNRCIDRCANARGRALVTEGRSLQKARV